MTATSSNEPTALQRAIAALEKMKARLEAVERAANEPIAIIGASCRFPGRGHGLDAFWRVLDQGVDAVQEIPAERWAPTEISEDKPEARWAALIDDIAGFDAAYFGISPREAESLDPQQRLLLEVVAEALDDAGQTSDNVAGCRGGVFIGMSTADHQYRVIEGRKETYDAYCATGNMQSTAAGRIAFTFDLRGPTMAIDTACSSSLVAIAQGCQSLRSGGADIVIAGGVNAIMSSRTMALIAETKAMSPDGRCKTLDSRANGYVRGEGAGIIIMKRLSTALRDGDRIHAILRSWAVNHDGRSSGLTAPNVLSQEAMLREVLERAKLTPADVDYIEMHGTGTSLGDPIETEALIHVLGAPRADQSKCILGAVKTNIGHLEGAAGVAGLIKILLSLKHEQIPKNLHFKRLNPRVSLDGTPFVIPTAPVSWPKSSKPRRAGVSSFGISGTNAHILLEEAPTTTPKSVSTDEAVYVLPISAKTPAALIALARSYADWFGQTNGDVPLRDVVHTASTRRTHLDHRLAIVARTQDEFAKLLGEFALGNMLPGIARGSKSKDGALRITYVFSGQGSQWAEMGKRLLADEPTFRDAIERMDALLRRHVSWSLKAELSAQETASRLDQTEIVQPALFAVQVGLVELLQQWGVVPEAVIGHSVGEIAAAHIAGALSLENALRLVVTRGRIMQKATGGGKMAWVALPAEKAQYAIAGLEDKLAVAAINDPDSCVLSGSTHELEIVLAQLAKQGTVTRPLRVDYAFHSPQMEPLAREFATTLGPIDSIAPKIAMYSTVTGTRVDGQALTTNYWTENIRATVNLAGAVRAALDDGTRVFVEIGPHAVLTTNLQQCISAQNVDGLAVPTLRRQREEKRALLETVAALHTQGHPIAWKNLQSGNGQVVSLPSYPWQHERYWIESKGSAREAPNALDEYLYELRWQSDTGSTTIESNVPSGRWVIFTDATGVGEKLAVALRRDGQTCTIVQSASDFGRVDTEHYEIAPSNAAHHQRILEDLSDKPIHGIVHLFSLDTEMGPASEADVPQHDIDHAVVSVLHLYQAILGRNMTNPPKIHVVTRAAQSVGATDTPRSPIQTAVWGTVHSVMLENPEMDTVLVDLARNGHSNEIAQLQNELARTDHETHVSLRADGRHVGRLVRSRVDAAAKREFQFNPNAAYLVTGDIDTTGTVVAEWMGMRGARNIVLIEQKRETTSAQVDRTRRLEATGATISSFTVDLANLAAVQKIFEQLRSQNNKISGIFHLPEMPTAKSMSPIADTDIASFRNDLLRKVRAISNLTAACRHLDLDFFVANSSVFALIGNFGYAGEAAANSFMSASMDKLNTSKSIAMTLQWGGMSDPTNPIPREISDDNRFVRDLPPPRMLDALSVMLERPRSEIVIADLVPARFAIQFPNAASRPFWSALVEEVTSSPSGTDFMQSIASLPFMDQVRHIENLVLEQASQVLRLDASRIDMDAPFASLGMDSLMGLELRNRLEHNLGIKLAATLIFAHPTATALVGHLAERLELDQSNAEEPLPQFDNESNESNDDLGEPSEDDVEARLRAKLASLEKYFD